MFRTLNEVREITENWIRQYNEERPHDALDDLTPLKYLATRNPLGNSNFVCNSKREVYMNISMIRSVAKRIPGMMSLNSLYREWKRTGKTKINIIEVFPLFSPSSAGTYKSRAPLTIQAINQFVPALVALAREVGVEKSKLLSVEDFLKERDKGNSEILRSLFQSYGSDKASTNDYFIIYASLLSQQKSIEKVLEIGLGTNYVDIVSTMGRYGKPGASLRAFRDFLPNAKVYGADIDQRVLFREDRIDTFHIDQTDPATFEYLAIKVGDQFDLMIDDGLHSPNANIHSLTFFLQKLKVGGYAVIEDIPTNALDVWMVVSVILPDNFNCQIIQTKAAYMFVVCRAY